MKYCLVLLVVLCAGCSRTEKKEVQEDKSVQTEKVQQSEQKCDEQKTECSDEENQNDMKLRLDPLGKFKTPGRCVGWICF
jgi:uncharacterized protein YcfL